ncbi:hypothetical protein NL108_003198 [Boleophthalmus pectinirostris]|nr:hypothetical protein NL108_003198 [Boleophthalmus pectinirostris]
MPLPTVSRLFRHAVRTQVVPFARVSAKPAQHNISAGEQAFALTCMFAVILGPSGWVLAHLEDYKKRE